MVVRGEVAVSPPAVLPASDCSSGICTFRRGRDPPPTFKLFEREGGVNVVSGIVGMELRELGRLEVLERCGKDGDESDLARDTAPTSTDWDRLPSSLLRGSAVKESKCIDRID